MLLQWNVFVWNVNKKQIEIYNIFEHGNFLKSILNECFKDFPQHMFLNFDDILKRNLMYYFWSKCEWEIMLSSFPPCEKYKPKKIDVYTQVMANFENFCNYFIDVFDSFTYLTSKDDWNYDEFIKYCKEEILDED